MSLDSAVAIVWDVLKKVVVPIKRQFGFVISSKSYTQDLQKEVGKLAYEAERIHNAAEVARNNLQKVYSQVMEWQARAEQALKEARDLLGAFEESSKTCCHGTLPDPNCRYQFSWKAKDKIKDIQQLAREGSEFKDISFSDPAPGNVAAPTPAEREGKNVVQSTTVTASASYASASIKLRDGGIFESRASIILDIIDALANNSNSVVGVHGMGGVGKSTLLVDAERRIREKTLFDLVAKADVSANPDIRRIQGEIAHELGLDFKNEEFASVRAKLLCKRLENEKKKVLIILDNLWERLDLKSVGIPCGHDNKVIGCKLLLTSRDKNVLQTDMGCDRDFLLVGLHEEEAKDLFERMAGDKVHANEFKPLVDEALHKCAGFPFLIIAMAKYFKNARLSDWRDALKQIDMSTNKGIDKGINEMLQLSYDHLKGEEGDEAKSFLRLCVAYGVSKPSLEALVRYGMGLRLFREDSSMAEARDRLSSLVRTLQASSLLLDDEDANGFKIHDLVRGFVVSVSLRDHPFLVLKDEDKPVTELSKDKLKSCEAICFPYVNLEELPKELDCPELQMFLLFTNNESLEVPNSYFNSMRNLVVLNLTGIRLNRLSLPFQFLENLHTLCLDYCSLDNVASLGELKGLQILSFISSDIHRLPKEIGQLVELKLLDLSHCSQLEIIEPGVLRSLIKLELYMEDSFHQWSAMEQTPPTNASLIELNDMKNLCTLHVSIPNPSLLPKDLNFKQLTKYKIRIGNAWHWSKYEGSRTLDLELDPISDILRKGCIQSILHKTDTLFLDGLNDTEQSICALSQGGFPKLKHLQVHNSSSIQNILRWPSLTAFKVLESLLLKNLINLEKISNNNIASESFRALKVVQVDNCDEMEILFPLSVVRELPQLEEIEVVRCKLMRGIVEVDDCGKVELRNLRVLKLRHLPYIKNFLNAGSAPSSSTSDNQVGIQIAFFNGKQVSIPSLDSLTMKGLPNLKEIWSDESPLESSNLRSLKLVRCESLSKVISSTSLLKLHKLQTLTIQACISMQEIFDLDGPSGSGNLETLSELTTISLGGLPSLRCIWNKNPCGIVTFHALKKLEVDHCDNLGFIFFPSMVKTLTQLRDLMVKGCDNMEAIITEEEGFGMEISETLAFPMLTDLRLSWLNNLTCFSRGKCSREARSQDHFQSCSAILFNQEVAFPRLETLEISHLDNLGFMFFASMVKSLTQLKKLNVWYCKKMEAIIMEEEGLGMETSETLAFPMLTDLHLYGLESLTCFSRGKCKIDFFVFVTEDLHVDGFTHAIQMMTFFSSNDQSMIGSQEAQSQDRIQSRSTALFNREVIFPRLETLHITGLDNIVMIWDDQVATDSFPKLKSLCVGECNRLVNVVTSSILGRILSLERLIAQSCDSLKVVFKLQPLNPLDGRPIAHSPLKELKLIDLPKLKCVWDKELHRQVKFQCLRSVSIKKCESLTSLFPTSIARDLMQFEELKIKICGIVEIIEKDRPEELSINVEAIEGASHELKIIFPVTSSFQHLKTLDVSYCDGLSNMFTPTTATNLVALTKLRISKCRMFTEVISDEGGREGHVVAFNQLKDMELEGLTRLRCFSSGGYALMFPLLENVIVTGCLNMNFFSKGPIEVPKLKRVGVTRDVAASWFWKEDLNITIQNMFEEMVMLAGVKKILLSELPNLIGKWHSELNPIKSSWQLESLTVDKCPSFIKAIPSKLMLVLDNMETLQVRDCESLEEIFDLEGLEAVKNTRVLSSFTTLDLVNLPKLRRLWNKDLQGSLSYNFLIYITLYKCSNLRHAFAPSMARCLANLEIMEMEECDQMEGVIADEEGQGNAVEHITFPYLEYLKLECLPNLTSFLLGKNHMLECPKLEELTIVHCPKMRSLTWQSLIEIDRGTPSLFTPQVQFPQLKSMVLSHMDNLSKIWTGGPQETLTFDYLGEVEVQNCKSLENLFPHWVATSLTQLKKLRVECCGIEEIVTSGDDTPCFNIAQVLFPKLTSLVLHDMPRLNSFCPNLPTLNWPFLEGLRVTHCDKLNTLSFAASMNNWARRDDQQDLSYQEAEYSFERDFSNLERLLLVDKDVQMIRDGKLPDDIFGKPKALTLACFHDEKAIFPIRFIVERFQNLQSLEVYCSSFEDIFPDEGLVDEDKHLVLENLRELKLSKLHNLKCVWREDYLMAKILQSIETFEIWDCPRLTIIFPVAASFQNLTKLVVKNSSGLVYLVTASAITNLVHLTHMTIIGCERMKEIVANDRDEEEKMISLEWLRRLTLQNLPSLECFSSTTSCNLRFPSLGYIEVEECPQMKIFSRGTLNTPELQYVNLFRYKWDWNWKRSGDLNTTIQKLSA